MDGRKQVKMNNSRLDENIKRSQIKGEKDANFPGVDFLNANMFVEAGAGAGKTTLIVERIVNQLKAGDEPGSFVVITFTNAAAEELRERITKKVKDEGLNHALDHLDEMNISTIHSFCNVLLKEQSILAGLPQSMQLMEPNDAEELQIKYLNEYMATLTSDDWDKIEKDAKEGKSRWQIKNDLAGLYKQIVDLPRDTNIITPRGIAKAQKVLDDRINIVNAIYGELFNKARALLNPEVSEKKKIVYNTIQDFYNDGDLASTKAIELINAFNNMPDQEKVADEALSILLTKKGNFFKSVKKVAYLCDSVAAVNKKFNEFVEERIGAIREILPSEVDKEISFVGQLNATSQKEAHFQCLLKYAKSAKEYYYKHKPVAMVSNDNLLEITRDLICNENDTRALEFFANKYKHFYVDEFQDTDRIQESFIYRLASDLSDKEHIKLRDGALFVVGDPKQSIYRFRGAQPQIYFDVKERMSSDSMKNAYVYELAKNFRSNGEIIGWVNDVFELSDEVMPIVNSDHPYSKMSYDKDVYSGVDYTMPDGAKYDEKKLLHGIYKHELCDSTHMGEKLVRDYSKNATSEYKVVDGLVYNDGYTVEDDIDAVVNLILNIVNQKYMITRYDKNNGFAPYPDYVRFKDFLLIPYDTTEMEKYLNAFSSYGIPVNFAGKANLNTDKVLNTFTRLYWYMINPKEPFHRMAAKEAIRESKLINDVNELETYTDYLLDSLYYGARDMSVFGKAVYLEKQLSALLDKDRVYDVIELYSIKTRLRQMIETVLNGATGTGVQLAQSFDNYVQTSIEHELSLEPDADAVRFMNLHKTKGLEGEIVIFLDRRGYSAKGISSLKDGNSYYPGLPKSWSSVSGLQIYEDKNKLEEEAEFHRLEYVAVTRAKQAVIFMNVIKHNGIFATSSNQMATAAQEKRKEKGMEDKGFNYHIDDLPYSVVDIINSNKNSISTPVVKDNYKLSNDGYGIEKTKNEFLEPVYEKVNPSGLEKKSSTKGRCMYQNKKMLESEIVDATTSKTRYDVEKEKFDRPFGNILGNVLHRTMELVVDRYDSSNLVDEDIKKVTDFCTRQAVKENEYDIPATDSADAYYEYVRKTAYAYYKWLNESKILEEVENVFTEIPFSYYTQDTKIWMKGTADLIIKYKDGQVALIDYKSDNDFLVDEGIMHKGFEEKYAPQLAEYKKIIQRMFGTSEEKIKAGIISFSLKDEAENRLDGDRIRVRYTEL